MADQLDDLAGPERRLCEVLAAYFEAQSAGQAPEREAWLEAHPDLADQLAEFLDERDRLLRLTEPLRTIAGAAPEKVPGDNPALGFWPGPLAASGDATVSDLKTATGRLFGDYELLDEIARGGMGVVYKARQTSLNRFVALKMLRIAALADLDSPRRFRLEAEATANLDHPNIIPIYEVGELDGFSFFTMKLVEGGSLAQHLPAYIGNPRGAAQLVATVARAVHHAHQRGVLHRDLKPSNIVIDAAGQPHVTDFGLARRVEGDPELTQSGAILGTPSYMAPEQASGQRKAISTVTDVYGLGAVLYALLTGKPPFKGDSVLETLDQVRQAPPEPPSGIGRRLDRDLEAICLKCLEKEPEGRYPSALALAEDLERWLAGKPTQARPLSRPARLRRWASRRWKRLAAAAALLVILGLIGIGIVQDMRLRRAGRLLDAQRQTIQKRDEAARQTQYMSDIRRAAALIAGGDARKALELLDQGSRATGPDDLRGFEWFYLRGQTDVSLAAWSGHEGRDIYHVEYAPDGRRLATAGADGTARVWDAQSRKELLVLRGHNADVNCVSFDPSGRRLVTAGEDGRARIWDASDGHVLAVLDSTRPEVVAALFTPDGRDVIAATSDGLVVRWDAATGDKRAKLKHELGDCRIESMAISPQGTKLAIAATLFPGRGSTLILHNVGDGGLTATTTITPLGAQCVAFAPDGKTLAVTGSRDQHVGVYGADTGNLEVALTGLMNYPITAAYSPDGRTLAVGYDSSAVRLWDLATKNCRVTQLGHTEKVWCVAFAPHGHAIATTSRDGTIRLWDPAARTDRLVFHGPERNPHSTASSVALAHDGAQVLAASASGEVLACDLTTMAVHRSQPLDWSKWWWDSALISPRGTHLVALKVVERGTTAADWRYEVVVHDLRGGENPTTISPRLHMGSAPIWSTDGLRIAQVDLEGNLMVWDISGRLLGQLDGEFGAGSSRPAFLPGDNAIVASCGEKVRAPLRSMRFIRWEPRTSSLDRWPVLDDRGLGYARLLVSPDGRTIAAHYAALLTLWNLSDLSRRCELVGHHDNVTHLAFAPDGRTLATASLDHTVRLWSVASGQELLALEGHAGPVRAVAFSADGRVLASCGDGPGGGIEVIAWRADRGARSAAASSQQPPNRP
ncbi:MAG: protein kinase domain-containing protein [Isosphaeraceae bacterium]